MRKFGILFVGLIVSLLAAGLHAGERCEDCVISMVGCSNVHHGLQTCKVTFDRNHNDPSNCSHNDNEMIIDVSNEGGKAMLSIALAAQATNSKVYAYGSGTCSLWSTDTPRETMDYLYIKN